jgi:hypothetical protein
MLTDSIINKINELQNSKIDCTSVYYGNKIVDNINTNERAIVFSFEKKKPLNEIPINEIIPLTIDVDGVTIKTDVVEQGYFEPLACSPSCANFDSTNIPINRSFTNPIMGGMGITSSYIRGTGTMGFIAVDSDTDCLLGVTNSHVLLLDQYYSGYRDFNLYLGNELNNVAIQPANDSISMGGVIRYKSFSATTGNSLDVALFYLKSDYVSNTESFKQIGSSYTLPMEFATTAEINNLLTTNPPIYSSGYRTGAKGDADCRLRVYSLAVNGSINPYRNQYKINSMAFSNCIGFQVLDCSNAAAPGDSGSAVIADFGGVRKIIGLLFAGGGAIGIACRIDTIASQMGIYAWDGTPKKFVDPNSITIKTISGGSYDDSYICNGKTYWQLGMTNNPSPC